MLNNIWRLKAFSGPIICVLTSDIVLVHKRSSVTWLQFEWWHLYYKYLMFTKCAALLAYTISGASQRHSSGAIQSCRLFTRFLSTFVSKEFPLSWFWCYESRPQLSRAQSKLEHLFWKLFVLTFLVLSLLLLRLPATHSASSHPCLSWRIVFLLCSKICIKTSSILLSQLA